MTTQAREGEQADYAQISHEDQWGETETIQEELLSDICPYEKIKCSAWNAKLGCEAEFCFMKVKDNGTSV